MKSFPLNSQKINDLLLNASDFDTLKDLWGAMTKKHAYSYATIASAVSRGSCSVPVARAMAEALGVTLQEIMRGGDGGDAQRREANVGQVVPQNQAVRGGDYDQVRMVMCFTEILNALGPIMRGVVADALELLCDRLRQGQNN